MALQGTNLLTELDAPTEYHVAASGLVHFMPATPMAQWTENPVVSLNATAVHMDGVRHVVLQGMAVAHSKATGISAINTTNITISNCTLYAHGGFGIDLTGTGNTVKDTTVFDVGCTGIQVRAYL